MQYEIILITLTAFGGLALSMAVYLNDKRSKANDARITKMENELAEWGKEIEKE